MPSKASMTQPTENIPTNEPPWHGQSQLPFWAKRPIVIRTSRIGALHQLANQKKWPRQAVDAMVAVITHVHPASTFVTPRILNFQNYFRPSQTLWPTTRHNAAS